MPINLTVPDRERAPAAIDPSARVQSAWVRELPLARALDAATSLTERLHLLNACRVDAEDRLDILSAFRGVAVVLLEELEHTYTRAALQSSGGRGRECLAVARALSAELSTGYRVAIVDRRSRLLSFGGKRDARTLVYRAMEHASAVLDASYRAYAPVPMGAWRQLHELYLYAEQEALLDEVADLETRATVRELYVRSLLVSLVDPYRLVRGELDRYLDVARFALGAATLGPGSAARGAAQFIVPCDTDKPPKPALSASDDTGGPNWRLLDASALVEKLRARKQALEGGNVSAALRKAAGAGAPAILDRLVLLWGDPPKRAHRRDRVDATVAVCVGLKSLWHFVSIADEHGEPPAGAVRKGITIPMRANPEALDHPVFEWEVVNQSAGGLKVRRTQPMQSLAIGDLVGVKMVDRPGWIVAVARWITTHDDGAMEFGIQFLAEGARAVWFEPTIAANPEQRQALWIEDDAADAALVTAADNFADLREFEVHGGGEPWRVRATHLVEKTGRFEQFQVAPS